MASSWSWTDGRRVTCDVVKRWDKALWEFRSEPQTCVECERGMVLCVTTRLCTIIWSGRKVGCAGML